MYGVHSFMVQIRDENHKPYPGIEVGDLGPKLGDHANDTGIIIIIINTHYDDDYYCFCL